MILYIPYLYTCTVFYIKWEGGSLVFGLFLGGGGGGHVSFVVTRGGGGVMQILRGRRCEMMHPQTINNEHSLR